MRARAVRTNCLVHINYFKQHRQNLLLSQVVTTARERHDSNPIAMRCDIP